MASRGVSRELEIKEMIKRTVLSYSKDLRGYQVFLFGSRVVGGARERSDFDVGVYGRASVPATLFFAIEEALDSLPTLYKIDWVDLSRVAPTFRQEAMKKIEVLYG